MGDESRIDYRKERVKALGITKTVAKARASDPETSAEAAASIEMTDLEQRVFREFQKCPNGTTTVHVAQQMGLGRDSVTPRIKPLVNKGYLRDTNLRIKGPSGRRLIVWQPVQR